MKTDVDSLRDLVLAEVPKSLFQRLAQRQPLLYLEASNMAHSYSGWGRTEAESVTPLNRRALFENELREAATLAGVRAYNRQHKGKNYWYVFVKAGKIGMTAHHVQSPTSVVRNACSRQQDASVNDWLDLPFIEELLQELPPQLGDANSVVAHVLHGVDVQYRAGQRFESQFLRLAFPDPEIKRYVRNYNILDLLQGYEDIRSASATNLSGGPLPDQAMPSLKPNVEEIVEREKREADRPMENKKEKA